MAPIVNHDWEHRFYFGRLVAVHRSGLFVAYVLKGMFVLFSLFYYFRLNSVFNSVMARDLFIY